MRNFLLESLKNRDGLTNVCCSALWMLMGSDIAFAMTFAVKAGDKELFCSKTIYSCLFLKKANKKPTKQQKLFTVYYQPNWIVIFRRVSMLNSETEFEECVPIILDLDAVSPLNSKQNLLQKVFFPNLRWLFWSWRCLSRPEHLEDICFLGLSSHPCCKWCAEQRWSMAAMLSVQWLSVFVDFSASGKFELIRSSSNI